MTHIKKIIFGAVKGISKEYNITKEDQENFVNELSQSLNINNTQTQVNHMGIDPQKYIKLMEDLNSCEKTIKSSSIIKVTKRENALIRKLSAARFSAVYFKPGERLYEYSNEFHSLLSKGIFEPAAKHFEGYNASTYIQIKFRVEEEV